MRLCPEDDVEERGEAHLCAGSEGASLICSTAWHLLSSVPSWHTIVRISLERNVRISSRHPHVERVMHEQIGQQRTDHPRIDDAAEMAAAEVALLGRVVARC